MKNTKMQYVVKRLGFELPRGVVPLFFVLALLVGGAFWVGPFRPRPAQLRLVALSGDGRFNESVGIPTAWAKLLPPASEATARLPLILGVHNAGVRAAQPTEVALSLPSRFRVTDSRGIPLPSQSVIGNPLVRYELALNTPAIEPGHLPTIIGGRDTLWLEPIVPTMYCTQLSDSVPEFVSAPSINPASLSRVRVYYSFSGPRIRQRQTGLLTIQVDPELVKRAPTPEPPIFATQVFKPQAPRPAMSEIKFVGSRSTWCGDPGQPMEIFDALWETQEGGRFFVLYNGGVPRKYLFDLNRDSVVELEMWDQDADGKFESQRAARMAIPAFLMPYPKDALDVMSAADSLLAALDTVQLTPEWLQLFNDTLSGVLRFHAPPVRPRQPPPSAAAPDSAATTPAETGARAPADAVAPPTPEFLNLFNNTRAGPLRFYRAARGETIAAPAPRPRPDTGPRLLGVPLDEYRRQRNR